MEAPSTKRGLSRRLLAAALALSLFAGTLPVSAYAEEAAAEETPTTQTEEDGATPETASTPEPTAQPTPTTEENEETGG